jgi:hypothetical protein
MHRRHLFTRSLLVLCALALFISPTALAASHADDRSDAWENVSKMIQFIEMGELSSTETAGNRAIGSIDKAIDREEDQSKKDKLRDASTEVKEALSNATKGEWRYAEGSAKRALKLLEEAQ